MSRSPQNESQTGSVATRSRTRKRDEIVEIGIRLLDDAHAAWQRAELECEQLLSAWYEGSPRAAVDWYRSYQAALDREEAAARDLERLWEVASGSAASDSPRPAGSSS
jgi:hypothetical protein